MEPEAVVRSELDPEEEQLRMLEEIDEDERRLGPLLEPDEEERLLSRLLELPRLRISLEEKAKEYPEGSPEAKVIRGALVRFDEILAEEARLRLAVLDSGILGKGFVAGDKWWELVRIVDEDEASARFDAESPIPHVRAEIDAGRYELPPLDGRERERSPSRRSDLAPRDLRDRAPYGLVKANTIADVQTFCERWCGERQLEFETIRARFRPGRRKAEEQVRWELFTAMVVDARRETGATDVALADALEWPHQRIGEILRTASG